MTPGRILLTTMVSTAVVLRLEQGERRLERVRTASGAKYQDGTLSFWTKGNEALLQTGDGSAVNCRQLREPLLRPEHRGSIRLAPPMIGR